MNRVRQALRLPVSQDPVCRLFTPQSQKGADTWTFAPDALPPSFHSAHPRTTCRECWQLPRTSKPKTLRDAATDSKRLGSNVYMDTQIPEFPRLLFWSSRARPTPTIKKLILVPAIKLVSRKVVLLCVDASRTLSSQTDIQSSPGLPVAPPVPTLAVGRPACRLNNPTCAADCYLFAELAAHFGIANAGISGNWTLARKKRLSNGRASYSREVPGLPAELAGSRALANHMQLLFLSFVHQQ